MLNRIKIPRPLIYTMIIIVTPIVIVEGVWWYIRQPPPIDPACFARKVVLVDIGGTVMAVPRSYRPVFHAPEGGQIPYADKVSRLRVCQKETDPPLRVGGFGVIVSNKFGSILFNSNKSALNTTTENYRGFAQPNYVVQYYTARITEKKLERREQEIRSEIALWQQHANQILTTQPKKEN